MHSPRPGVVTINLPIRAPGLHRLRNVELCESFVAGGIAFIHRQQTFVVGNQFAGSIY